MPPSQSQSATGKQSGILFLDELKVDEARNRLTAQVRELSDIMEEIREAQLLETQALDMGSGAGLGLSDSNAARPAKRTQ